MLVTRCTPHPVSLLLEAALERFSRKHRAYASAHAVASLHKTNRMFDNCVARYNWMVRRRRKIVEERGDLSLFEARGLCQWAWYECDDRAEYVNWLSAFERARCRIRHSEPEMERFSELPCDARMMVIRYTPHPVALLLVEALRCFSQRHQSYENVCTDAMYREIDRNTKLRVLHHNWKIQRRRKIVETRGDLSVFRSIDLVQWDRCEHEDWDEYSDWLRARSRSPRSSGNRSARRV